MSVLITAASSAQAYQLKGILNADEPVLLGDYTDMPDLMIKSGAIIKTPNPESASFAHEMLTLCLDLGVHQLIPLRKAELLPLEEARLLFLEFDINLIIPNAETIKAHLNPIEGSVVVLNRSEVLGGNRHVDIPQGLTDGVFRINHNGDYQIYTAD